MQLRSYAPVQLKRRPLTHLYILVLEIRQNKCVTSQGSVYVSLYHVLSASVEKFSAYVRIYCAQGLNGGCHSFSAILYKISELKPGEISMWSAICMQSTLTMHIKSSTFIRIRMAVEVMFYEIGKGYKRPAKAPNVPSYGSSKVGIGCLPQLRAWWQVFIIWHNDHVMVGPSIMSVSIRIRYVNENHLVCPRQHWARSLSQITPLSTFWEIGISPTLPRRLEQIWSLNVLQSLFGSLLRVSCTSLSW